MTIGFLYTFLAAFSLNVTSSNPDLKSADWHPGDEITAIQNGKTFTLKTRGEGPTAEFSVDGDVPEPDTEMYIGFNVKSISEAGLPAFEIASEQVPGELSNRLPQFARVAPLASAAKMTALAKIIEFKVCAEESFRITRIAFLPRSSSDITGLNLPETDIKNGFTGCVILPDKEFGKVPLIVNFFNGIRRNMRFEIKDFRKPSVDFGKKRIGIASTEDFLQLVSDAARGDKYGLRFCDENGVVSLKSDIDLSGKVTEEKPWNGIGNFEADFDGCGHAIFGYRIVNPTAAGIFLSTKGSVRNVQFGRPGDGSLIESRRPDYAAAAPIAATMDPTKVVENCTNYSEIRVSSDCRMNAAAGGIVAQNRASISNCTNYGRVEMAAAPSTRTKYVGGIVGAFIGDNSSFEESITGCTNQGAVCSRTSGQVCVGGIAGRLCENGRAITISRCSNTASISIEDDSERIKVLNCLGGIVGEIAKPQICHDSSRSTVSECANSGTVTSNSDGLLFAGGIVGRSRVGTVSACANSGEVSHFTGNESDQSVERNYSNLGGIAGIIYENSKIDRCSNTGSVTAICNTSHRMGGIVGDSATSSILASTNGALVSLNEGRKVSGPCAAGGIAGLFGGEKSTVISGCTNSGEVRNISCATGRNVTAGGIIGTLTGGTVRSCLNTAPVSARNELILEDISALAGGLIGKTAGKNVSYINNSASRVAASADAPNAASRDCVVSSPTVGYSFGETVIK